MEGNEVILILSGLAGVINAFMLIVAAWRKLKPEVKKMENEADSENVEAANLNLEGAKISTQMLVDRINELRGELATERKLRTEGMEFSERRRSEEVKALEAEYSSRISALEKARREDVEYFRRRIKDLERESRDYRTWAARLVKQVVEAGKIPHAFTPTFGDSDVNLQAVRPELETGPLSPFASTKPTSPEDTTDKEER